MKNLDTFKDTLNNPNKVYQKLNYVFNSASAQDTLDGARWYAQAESMCEVLSTKYGHSKMVIASVVSCLSPACSWSQNIKDANHVLELWSNGSRNPEDATCSTYGNNVIKAYKILETGNPEFIGNGLKTTSFACNLAGLWNDNAVTIDRHMLGLAVGSRSTLHQKISVTAKRYRTISEAVKRIAKNKGLEPRQVQAILWESFRTRVGLKK